jgi:hypothetical protein
MTDTQRQRLLDAIEIAKTDEELDLAKAKLAAFDEATS